MCLARRSQQLVPPRESHINCAGIRLNPGGGGASQKLPEEQPGEPASYFLLLPLLFPETNPKQDPCSTDERQLRRAGEREQPAALSQTAGLLTSQRGRPRPPVPPSPIPFHASSCSIWPYMCATTTTGVGWAAATTVNTTAVACIPYMTDAVIACASDLGGKEPSPSSGGRLSLPRHGETKHSTQGRTMRCPLQPSVCQRNVQRQCSQ